MLAALKYYYSRAQEPTNRSGTQSLHISLFPAKGTLLDISIIFDSRAMTLVKYQWNKQKERKGLYKHVRVEFKVSLWVKSQRRSIGHYVWHIKVARADRIMTQHINLNNQSIEFISALFVSFFLLLLLLLYIYTPHGPSNQPRSPSSRWSRCARSSLSTQDLWQGRKRFW